MSTMESQITSLTIVYSIFSLGADKKKHQSAESLAFGRGIRRWPVDYPQTEPATRKMFPFDDVIMSRGEFTTIKARELWFSEYVMKIISPSKIDMMKWIPAYNTRFWVKNSLNTNYQSSNVELKIVFPFEINKNR